MEKEIEYLKTQLIRIQNYPSIFNSKKINYDQCYLANQILNEHEKHQIFSQQIKDEFQRIDSLVYEANTIANEMQGRVVYKTILHIPVSYLKPNERSINNLCEIAIQVKYDDSPLQIWDIEKFEFKLRDIKEVYNQWKTSENLERMDPFFDNESESLIGVANIYLKALFYNSKLDYIVPIINTQGEISGSLHVVLDRTESLAIKNLSDFRINSTTQGSISEGIGADIDEQSLSNSQPSLDDEGIDELSALSNGKNEQITVKFAIKEVRDLPKTDAEHIICRYTFINPKLDQQTISIESSDNENKIFSFDHENEYTFPITDRFLSTCIEGAVSIEVCSQYKSKQRSIETTETEKYNAKVWDISRRWKNVKRHVQFSVEIQELDTTGQWGAVEVDAQEKIISGGIYRLKQGQSKRLIAQLRIIPRSDPMPLSFHAIRSVEIGSINTRKIDAPCQLDSYQDEDLRILRSEWSDLIEKQKIDLEYQVNLLNQQTDKTPDDNQKERILLEQLVRLADERNIASFPPISSGIPGAPTAWQPPITIEKHRPLIFLNTNQSNEIAGLRTILNEEDESKMLSLPLIQQASDEVRAVALWDPAIHESPAMNQVTPQDTIIYLIVKITVLITEPAEMDVVLRKRIAVTINKSEGWWPEKTFKNLLGYKPQKRTSVVYEIISNIPKTIYTTEDSECRLSQDSIDKNLQYASTIDSVLLLDQLRQEVLLAENSVKQQTLRKATSAPNIMPQKRHKNLFHSPVNSRRETIPNQISSIPNDPIIFSTESEFNNSTPSLLSRSLFIEEEQLQPILTSTFQIKHTIDLEDNKEQSDENTLELKYLGQIIENKNRDYSIGCRVIVNTGHSIFDQPGIIRFIGEMCIKEGIWYGIELEEPIGKTNFDQTKKLVIILGKNNGSIGENTYFQCPDKHGVFVRRDKIRLAD